MDDNKREHDSRSALNSQFFIYYPLWYVVLIEVYEENSALYRLQLEKEDVADMFGGPPGSSHHCRCYVKFGLRQLV